MSRVIVSLSDAIKKLNTLYNTSSTPPNPGDEDYLVWTDLLSTGITNWEAEEGMLWRQLFTRLADAVDGDKVTTTATTYACPALFKFPNSAYVWLGSGDQRTAFKVMKQEEIQLLENDNGNWCYFLLGATPTLVFNPNLKMTAGATIDYNYYKYANDVTTGTDKFEMSDPMYAVYYALSELKKDEGDTTAYTMMLIKMENMKTLNYMTADYQQNDTTTPVGNGFGTQSNGAITR